MLTSIVWCERFSLFFVTYHHQGSIRDSVLPTNNNRTSLRFNLSRIFFATGNSSIFTMNFELPERFYLFLVEI
jgi:hypothetical protein